MPRGFKQVRKQIGKQVVIAVDVGAESEVKSSGEGLGGLGIRQTFRESLLQVTAVIPGAWVRIRIIEVPRIFLKVEPEQVLLLNQPVRAGNQRILQNERPGGHGPNPDSGKGTQAVVGVAERCGRGRVQRTCCSGNKIPFPP